MKKPFSYACKTGTRETNILPIYNFSFPAQRSYPPVPRTNILVQIKHIYETVTDEKAVLLELNALGNICWFQQIVKMTPLIRSQHSVIQETAKTTPKSQVTWLKNCTQFIRRSLYR